MADRSLDRRELLRLLKKYGAWENSKRGKGSHTMYFRMVSGSKFSFPVPTHDKEVNARYVRGCRKRLKLTPDDGVTDEEFYG